jgi:hypothetical protein
MADPKTLRLVKGGKAPRTLLDTVQMVSAPESAPPFAVDALLLEQDTALVLGADPKPRVCDEHPIRIMTDLLEFQEKAVGSIIITGQRPYRLYAIVHDFGQEPSTRDEWIGAALETGIDRCLQLKIRSLGTHMLGSHYSSRDPNWFCCRLTELLATRPPGSLHRIWMIAPRPKARRGL